MRLTWVLFCLLSWGLCAAACTPPEPQGEPILSEVRLLDGSSTSDAGSHEHFPESNPPTPERDAPTDAGVEPDRRSAPEVPVEEEPTLERRNPPEREPIRETTAPDQPIPSRWIGEACTRDEECDYTGGVCLRESAGYPAGHCSKSCTTTCPDKAGKPVTFCVANSQGQGTCVSQCEKTSCRKGYLCQPRARVSDANKVKRVCLPPAAPGASLTFLYIGDSQSSGTRFASHMVSFLQTPRARCPGARNSTHKVFSYAKVSSAARHWSAKTGTNKAWLCGAKTVYTNNTAPYNTNGSALCKGITSASTSIFERLTARHGANAFFVQLGGNSAGFNESYVKGKVKQMLDQMPAGAPCFWVSPSFSASKYLPKRKNVETWLKKSLQAYTRVKCSLLTSIDEMSKQTSCPSFNSSDGLHMSRCGSQLWGELISKKLCALGKL